MDLESAQRLVADPAVILGRGDHVQTIGKLLESPKESGRALLLNGFHGIGKTSLAIKYAASQQSSEKNFLYIDFRRGLHRNEEECVHFFYSEVAGYSGVNSDDRSSPSFRDAVSALRSLPEKSIVLLDEPEALLEYVSETIFLRYLWSLTRPDYFFDGKGAGPRVVLITQRDWQAEELRLYDGGWSPELWHYPSISLGALSKTTTMQLLIREIESENEFSEQLLKEVCELTGGHPFLIKQASRMLRDCGTESATIDFFAEGLFHRSTGYFHMIWKCLKAQDKIYIARQLLKTLGRDSFGYRLPAEPVFLDREKKCWIKGNTGLIERGLLLEGSTSIFSPLFSWWVAESANDLFGDLDKEDNFDLRTRAQDVKTTSDLLQSIVGSFEKMTNFLGSLGFGA